MRVLVLGARSAAPPMIQGIRSATAFSTLPDASRVERPVALGGNSGSAVSHPGGSVRCSMLSICSARSGYSAR